MIARILAWLRDAGEHDATWFIDPPYQVVQGEQYPNGAQSIDFAALGDWCRSRRGQVIVCESEGADWLPFSPLGAVQSMRKGSSRERVWLGGDS